MWQIPMQVYKSQHCDAVSTFMEMHGENKADRRYIVIK